MLAGVGRGAAAPRSPTISASRSASVRLTIEGPRDHRSVADPGRSRRRSASRCRWRGAREHHAPVQPRPVRGRARRRDARRRRRRAASTSSVPIHPVTRIQFAGRATRPASTRTRCAAPSSIATARRRRSAAPPTWRASSQSALARARLPARGGDAARAGRARIPIARRWCSRSIPARARRSAPSSSSDGRRCRAPSSCGGWACRPGSPYQREALSARIERYVDGAARAGLLRGAGRSRRSRLADEDRVANLSRRRSTGPARPRRVPGDPLPCGPARRAGAGRARGIGRTRICSRTRATGSRSTCARRDIATRARRTRDETDGELLITFNVKRGPLYRVAHVEISGNASVPLERVRRRCCGCASASRSRDSRLDADVATIEDALPAARLLGGARARRRSSRDAARRRRRRCRSPSASSSPKACGRWSIASTFAGNEAIDASDAARAGSACRPGAPFVPGQLADRSRRDRAGVSEPRLSERDASSSCRSSAPTSTHVDDRRSRPRGAAGLRRPRADRRQRADHDRDDRARAAGQDRRSAQPRGDQREPAAAGRARPVPARADHRAAGTATRRRAICSSRSRKRRRRRSATAAASRATGSP